MWSVAWIWRRKPGRDAYQVIGDVSVVLLLWFLIVLLRYIFGGWVPDDSTFTISERPVFVGVTSLLGCLVTLVPVCATFAKKRWSFRLPIALIVVTVFWGILNLLWGCFELSYLALPLGCCLFVLIGMSLVCLFTRMVEWQLNSIDEPCSDHRKSRGQSAIADLFLFSLSIGLCITVFLPIF